MRYDEAKIDEAVLAVLYLTAWEEHGLTRAWKGIDWDASNRLYERGLIDDPKNKRTNLSYSRSKDSLSREPRRRGCSPPFRMDDHACCRLTTIRAIAGRVFGEPGRESMIGINQLRWSAAKPRVAQPRR